jgi:hypothetical protein
MHLLRILLKDWSLDRNVKRKYDLALNHVGNVAILGCRLRYTCVERCGLPSFRRKEEHGRHHSVVRNYALCREHADRRNLTIDVDGSASGMLWLAGGGAGMHSNHMNAYMRRSLDEQPTS